MAGPRQLARVLPLDPQRTIAEEACVRSCGVELAVMGAGVLVPPTTQRG